MTPKIIQTKDYLLLIDGEADIQIGDYFLVSEKVEQCLSSSEADDLSIGNDSFFKIIAYFPLTKEAKELDLPLLPNPFENDKGLEKSLNKYIKDLHSQEECIGFIDGYKAAQQSKQFSLEDMIAFGKKCFYKGFDKSENDDANCFTAWREESNELVQSLSTQQLPKEFIPEYEYYYHSSKEFYKDAKFEKCSKEQYKSIKEEIPTCPVKVELKTIINSKGKEEIQGRYVY